VKPKIGRRHLIIPDTQIQPGVPLNHITWAAKAIRKYKPDVICVLGDWWDMHSLNSYDKPGSKRMEGARYAEDIKAGNDAMAVLTSSILSLKEWPECHFFMGNHEDRITRAINAEPKFSGTISLKDLDLKAFEVHDYLEVVNIDGVFYSHYFSNTHSSYPIGGSIDNRLNKIGESFVQGHQQGFQYGTRVYPTGKTRHGLVAGSFYLHDEDYRGPQNNNHWNGIVVLNEVEDGDYNIMPLGMNYLRATFGTKKEQSSA